MTRRITNRYPGECRLCDQTVPEGAGVAVNDGAGWKVEHLDACPPNPHNPAEAPTWRISRGEGYRGQPFEPGDVIRERWWVGTHGAPGADAVPGGRQEANGVSGIVVVVTATDEYFDVDGMTFGVGDESGYVYLARIRAATPDEAAPVLAREAVAARRRNLADRLHRLLAWRYPRAGDVEIPADVDPAALAALPIVPIGPARPVGRGPLYPDRLVIDGSADVLWTLAHNGQDGDDWAQSNAGRDIALRYRLTDDRRQLVSDLRAEYESLPEWTAAGYDPAAVELLQSAGWTLQLLHDFSALAAKTPPDAAALVTRTPQQWRDAGWRWTPTPAGAVPAADAARLANAGISGDRASTLQYAGFTTVDSKIQAAPPQLPSSPGRFILPGPRGWRKWLTDDPGRAAQMIEHRPDAWQAWQHHPGVTCVHASDGSHLWSAHASDGWQLWSDGSITVGKFNPVVHGVPDAPPAPQSLTAPAAELVGLVATAVNAKDYPRDVRLRLATTIRYTSTTVAEAAHNGSSSWSGSALVRHDADLHDRGQVTMWEVRSFAGGWAGGDADHHDWRTVFADEDAARIRYSEESPPNAR